MKLNPYANLELQALVNLAVKQFADNADHIGSLNFTSDLLGQVINWIGCKNNARWSSSSLNYASSATARLCLLICSTTYIHVIVVTNFSNCVVLIKPRRTLTLLIVKTRQSS